MGFRSKVTIAVLISALSIPLLFQNCDFASRRSTVLNSELFDSKPVVSPSTLLANQERTPLGRGYTDGVLAVQAGSQLFRWTTAEGFTPISPTANQYTQGSTHMTVSIGNGEMLAVDMRTSASGQFIEFDLASSVWRGKYLKYASPFGDRTEVGEFTIDSLPGNSTDHYEPYSIFRTEKYTYVSLYRIQYVSEPWTKNGITSAVTAQVADSWMVRSSNESPYEFKFMGRIADAEDYRQTLAASGLSFELPLVYAASPRCVGLSDLEIVCATRGSADDDDGNRPLDESVVFHDPLAAQPLDQDFFFGAKVVRGIYSNGLLPNSYYVPKNNVRIPPLLISTSKDGGVSWERKLISKQGGIDAHFSFDSASGLLVLAYGGWTYPRRGITVQWSKDRGQTWSDPLTVSDASDRYTTGTVYLDRISPKRFLLVYDSLARYIEYDYNVSPPAPDPSGYRILYRTLDF